MPHWNSFAAFLLDALNADSDSARQALVDELLSERRQWPWIEGNKATFIYIGTVADTVALNLDTIPDDPPFDLMTGLPGTSLFYVTREFQRDDLLDYLLAVDDPLTPLATETDVIGRITNFWKVDPLNPIRMETPQATVSVLRMADARPFPDWSSLANVPRGRVYEHVISSGQLGFSGRRLWIYTPPGYDRSGDDAPPAYPLLILHDGQWMTGPLQVPYIADALIKHGRLQPALIAMIQSGTQEERNREYVSNDRHYAFLLSELLPLIQSQYRVDAGSIGVGGVAVGAIAAAHAALNNPAVFTALLMISPPLGRGPLQDQLTAYAARFDNAELLPKRIFQSVGRYEAKARFARPAEALRDQLLTRSKVAYKFTQIGSGHGLVGFRSILPEALAWVLPGPNAR